MRLGWQPVWHLLEDAFELMLVNARHVKQVPDRKTDVSDAAWLCQLAEGFILGASDHFGEAVEVDQPACVFHGDAACVLRCRFGPVR